MPSANVCKVLMYVNACQVIPGHARDYKACQHMLGECYVVLGHANMCLGILVMVICSKICEVPRNVSVCQSILRCARIVEEC